MAPSGRIIVPLALRPLERQTDDEAGVARLRLDPDVAAVAGHDDAAGDVQPEPGSLAHALGREERLPDPRLEGWRDARPVVGDLDAGPIALARRPNPEGAPAAHSVDGVVDQVGPDLVQLTPMGADLRQATVVLAVDRDGVLELVAEDRDGVLEAIVQVDLLLGSPIHEGVLLHRPNELGDAGRALLDLVDQDRHRERRLEPDHGVPERSRVEPRCQTDQLARVQAGPYQRLGEVPAL